MNGLRVYKRNGASEINQDIGIQEFRHLGYRLRQGELNQKLKLREKKKVNRKMLKERCGD